MLCSIFGHKFDEDNENVIQYNNEHGVGEAHIRVCPRCKQTEVKVVGKISLVDDDGASLGTLSGSHKFIFVRKNKSFILK